MPRQRFPFARPLVPRPEAWLAYLEPAYEAQWFTNRGPVSRVLEAELAERIGGGRAVAAVSSATAGLTATLLALGVRGTVVVPAFTFPATIHAIELAGCRPVLCDIDPTTSELDPASAREAVERHGCAAILHVRAFGMARDLTDIDATARELGVPLVIDAAASFGGRQPNGEPVGRMGNAEVFSFHATKVFAIGEGGAVAASPDLIERIHHVANFAIAGDDVTSRALNAKLAEQPSAVGRAMLQVLDDHVTVREHAAATLSAVARNHGAGVPGSDVGRPPWQCLPVELPAHVSRAAVMAALGDAGIESRAYYCPGLHRSTAWSSHALGPLPGTDELAARSLCVPIYSDLVGLELGLFGEALDHALAAGSSHGSTRGSLAA